MKSRVSKLLALLLLLSGVAQAITPWERYSVTEAIGKGAWETSEKLFRKLKESPLPADQSAQVDYNLGLSLYHQEKYDDALPLFESAAKSSNDALKAKALYNQGNSLFKLEKLDEAKAAYEKALLTNPDDDDTRHNIEVILKKQQQQQNQQNQQNQDNQDNQDQDKSDQQDDQKDQNSDQQDKGESEEKEQNKDQQNQNSEGEKEQKEQSGQEQKPEDGKPQEMTEAEKKAAREKAEQARLLDYFKQQERDGRPATRVPAQAPPVSGKTW